MDMGGIPWLDQPMQLHSSRENNCTMTPEQCEYLSGHFRNWYEADHVFALSTIYLFSSMIGVCFLGFWCVKLAPAGLRRRAWWQKLVGLFRFLAYRRWKVKALGWETPSVGVMFLGGTGFIYFMAMALGPQPYYWPDMSYGMSPPIATRSGWMALACLPFLLILATKANMIASLTGVSHERLMVFHQWVSWAMLVLALIHTFPFIIVDIQAGEMTELWNTSVFYWAGVAALVPQVYLNVMSIPWIRNKYYEFFKSTHYIAAIAFVIFLFIHCDWTLTSWDYFIAAGVLYVPAFLYSQIRTYFEHGVSLRATIVPVSDSTLKITIPVEHMVWEPGQHLFLRFLALGLHAFTSHPFSICSTPDVGSANGKTGFKALTFYIEKRGGITGRLAAAASKSPGLVVPVLLDGPYGGIKARPLWTYNRAVVISCGAGAGFSLPFVMNWILASARPSSTSEDEKRAGKMQVILATRDIQLLEWYEDALVDFLDNNGLPLTLDTVDIRVHVTGVNEAVDPASSHSLDEDKQTSVATRRVPRLDFKVMSGRADVRAVIREATLESGVSVGIAVCGPKGILKEAQDEAAAAQLRILGSGTSASEVYLHSEEFSW